MTTSAHKKKIDTAVFAAAGGLMLWAGYRLEHGAPSSNSPEAAAFFAGIGLATYGAYRVKPAFGLTVAATLLGVGAWNKHARETGKKRIPLPGVELNWKDAPNDGLDRDLSPDTRAAVHAALVVETDPAILSTFAHYLAGAGHWVSAHLVALRAAQLAPAVQEQV